MSFRPWFFFSAFLSDGGDNDDIKEPVSGSTTVDVSRKRSATEIDPRYPLNAANICKEFF